METDVESRWKLRKISEEELVTGISEEDEI